MPLTNRLRSLSIFAVVCLSAAHAGTDPKGPGDQTHRLGPIRREPAVLGPPVVVPGPPGVNEPPKTDEVNCAIPIAQLVAGITNGRPPLAPGAIDVDGAKAQLAAAGYTDLVVLGRGAHGVVIEGTYEGRPVAVKFPGGLYAMFLDVERTFVEDVNRHVRAQRDAGVYPKDGPDYFLTGARLREVPASGSMPKIQVMEMDRVAKGKDDLSSAEPLIRQMSAGPVNKELGDSLKKHIPRALEQLHAAGLVHRDLKPSNILVTNGNIPVIVDFGIAARRGTRPGQLGDDPNTTSGTLAYMGPEQHQESKASPKMDIFAGRKLLLEALVGQDLFGHYTEQLQTNPDPSKQENYGTARRWLRAPEDKIGRLGVALTLNVIRDGGELRKVVDMAEDGKTTDDAFYLELGALLSRESPAVIANELLCSKTLIARFPAGLGIDAALAKAVIEAYPEMARKHGTRRLQLQMYRQPSTVQDGNLYGYSKELEERIAALKPR